MVRRLSSVCSAMLIATALVGCAGPPPRSDPTTITPSELLRGMPITGAVDPAPVADMATLELDEDMRNFVAGHVDMQAPSSRRLRQLAEAVIRNKQFSIAYDENTYTAAQAFHLREANCLSFTNIFVALARQAGLKAEYEEVDIPPDWTQSGDILVLNRHVNAVIRSADGTHVVDFNMADFHAAYDHRTISDARALAHYYSNLGAGRMQAREDVEALRYFRKAIEQDASFAPAWINLGTLYLRAHARDFARAAWWHALTLAPGDPVAMSNLEGVYRQDGDVARADDLRGRIERYRMQNPYYRYYLARQAFDLGDYPLAIEHLKFAVREKKTEDRFLALLGLSYLRLGDRDAAREWILRAESATLDDKTRDTYHSKLELLRKAGTG